MINVLIGLFLMGLSSAAFAGNGGVGGGVGFLHNNKVYLADSFALHGTAIYKKLKALHLKDQDRALTEAVGIITSENKQIGEALSQALNEIHEAPKDLLDILGDDKIGQPPKGYIKVQLGIQHFVSGELEVYESLRDRLNSIDKLLFKLHEGYLRVLWKADSGSYPDIQAVRDQVFTWAKDPAFLEFISVAQVASTNSYQIDQIKALEKVAFKNDIGKSIMYRRKDALERILANIDPQLIKTNSYFFGTLALVEWPEALNLLIERGLDVEARDDSQDHTLLMAAAHFNSPGARILLEHGANPNAYTCLNYSESSKWFTHNLQYTNEAGSGATALDFFETWSSWTGSNYTPALDALTLYGAKSWSSILMPCN